MQKDIYVSQQVKKGPLTQEGPMASVESTSPVLQPSITYLPPFLSPSSPTRFRFDVHSPLMGGACHAIDLPYVFGSYRVFGRLCPADAEGNATLAQAVVKAWANFAKNGDPNTTTTTSSSEPPHLPTWPPLTSSDLSKLMIIDLPLSNSRVQSVKLHEAFPEMWKIALEDARVSK